ncbi:MAG: 4Fe-4S single cluster domain-containing protein [Eubacteriales bacterium]|nr:4Fe-4S single cluster domain-containing protein [Eubacteriales bacterium]
MSRLVLERIYYPVVTLGYGKRLGVWVRGCGRACPGCISPELQPYEGDPVEVAQLIASLPEGFSADGMTISGGEPFDQAEGVAELVRWFTEKVSRDVLVYTGYTVEELQARGDPATDEILRMIAVLVDGAYMEARNDGKGLRGSANQRVIVQRFPERYLDAESRERKVQYVGQQESLLQIGIPPGRKETRQNK